MLTAAILKEQIRKIFRIAAAGEQTAEEAIDALSDAALAAQQAGKTTISVSHQEATMGWATFAGWQPAAILELVSLCRDYLELYPVANYDDETAQRDAILASIKTVRSSRPDFRRGCL